MKMDEISLLDVPGDLKSMFSGQPLNLENSTSVFVVRDYLLSLEIDGSIDNMVFNIIDKERIMKYNAFLIKMNTEKNSDYLISLLDGEKDYEIKSYIYKKLIELNSNVYAKFFDKLKVYYSEECFDNAIIILGLTMKNHDISLDIIEFLKEGYIKKPSDFSSLMQLLGYRKNSLNLQYLYTYYKYFKDNFVNKDYYEGPAVGIWNYFNFEM
jgi:hypothetical protein